MRVAFRLAFWHLAHTPSYEAALIDTVNRGGDADTNAGRTKPYDWVLADDDLRHQAVRLMAVLEMVAHPLSAAAAA